MSTLKTAALRGLTGTADSIQLHTSNQSVTFPGAVTFSGTVTGDNAGCVKKIHTFEYATRVAGTYTDNSNQFTFTTAFTPLDSVNNGFIVEYFVPTRATDTSYAGFGLRFENTSGAGNQVDFQNKGTAYKWNSGVSASETKHSFFGQKFYIAANAINNAQQTIYLRITEGASRQAFYCPNSSDDSRIGTQSAAHLIITEYKN